MMNKNIKNNISKKGMNSFKKQGLIFALVMIAVPVCKMFYFWTYTNLKSLLLAFEDPRTGVFTFQNFKDCFDSFSNGGILSLALKNTMVYFWAGVLILLPGALVIAYFIYKKILGYKLFRIIFYFPAIISSVVMVTAYSKFIDPKGPLGVIMNFLGNPIPPEGLLGRPTTATWTILGYVIWTGFTTNVLYYSGAMARIPIDIIEAARLEGISPGKEIVLIVFPLIWPVFSTTLLMQFANILTASGPILLFTNGAFETSTLSYWMYIQVYGDGVVGGSGSYNLLSATGLVLTFVAMPIVLTVRWLSNKVESVEY